MRNFFFRHWPIFLFIVSGMAVFSNCFFNQFVWDDRTFIQFNTDLQYFNLGYLVRANMFNNINAGQYRFFVALYFTIMHKVFGNSVFFYHIFQVSLHIINTSLIFYLLKRFFKKRLSVFLSMIFLVHPMQVESVSYIASSGNPFFTFFGLTALILSGKTTSLKNDLFIFGLLLLSLLSKETGIIFILLVIVYRYLYLRINTGRYLGLGFLTLVLYSVMRFYVAGVYFSKVTLAPITRLSMWDRVLNIPAVVFYYLKTFIFPKVLIVEQYWTVVNPNLNNFYVPLILDGLFIGLIFYLGWYIYKFKQHLFKTWIFFSVWLISGLAMYSQIFALDMTVADRWWYFPLIGLLGIFGLVGEIRMFDRGKKTVIAAGLIILALAVRTMMRNTDWRDPITLYSHDGAVLENFDLENSLGAELNMVGKTNEAIFHFQKSVNLFPHETNLFNLGLAYETAGDPDKAEKYYFEALKAKSYREVPKPHMHHSVTYEKLGILLLRHDPQSGLRVINSGLADYENNAQLWYTKALCEYKENKISDALVSATRAFNLLPNNPSVRNLYNQLLQGKPLIIK